MPSFFDVPGWSVPAAPPQHHSKKRRRTADPEEQELLRNAQANFEKLVHSLGDNISDGAGGGPSSKKEKHKKHSKPTSEPSQRNQDAKGHLPKGKPHEKPAPPAVDPSSKKAKKKPAMHSEPTQSSDAIEHSVAVQDTGNLTPLQKSLKKSLSGARFRLLNETLYKSSSQEAFKMMKEDPKVFEDYHVGFRRQVQSWPTNPVSHYISELSSYPARTVVADLGCGDASLARALLTKNMTVISFDLVSDGAFVIEADICSWVPLPGSEPQSAETSQGEAQIVDVVVCALSLMSTNWPKCIREAWRILQPGGELMIAEVASRFASVHEFTSLIGAIGFKLQLKDDRNSHFTLFQFKKVARSVISEQEWTGFVSQGRVLKSCEYKRR